MQFEGAGALGTKSTVLEPVDNLVVCMAKVSILKYIGAGQSREAERTYTADQGR